MNSTPQRSSFNTVFSSGSPSRRCFLKLFLLLTLPVWCGATGSQMLHSIIQSSAQAADLLPPEMTIESTVDAYIQAKLDSEKVTPNPQANDGEFLRRLYLDLAGRIPTLPEADFYLTSTEPDKRTKLIERLIASPDYAYHQRNELDNMLLEKDSNNEWREYLLKACQENRPWDQIFRELLLSRDDDPDKKGALQFLKSRVRDLDLLTNDTSKVFFGISINCAKCHDHPLVLDWHQDHYYGMYSFFNRTYLNQRQQLVERDEGLVKFKTTDGVEKQAKLMFLTGTSIDEPANPMRTEEERKTLEKQRKEEDSKKEGPPPAPPAFSARSQLVEMALRAEENRFFTRSIVNRVWARLMGRGLVMPLDQMHSQNPASHPELLDWLARDLATHGYDLKRLVRGIVSSQAYSRSSRWDSEANPPHEQLFAVASTRPLTPRQYSLSLLVATRDNRNYPTDSATEWAGRRKSLEDQSNHLANQLEVPRDNFQVGVSEALFFNNNSHVQNDLLNEGGDRLLGYLKSISDRSQKVKILYKAVLTREPDSEEFSVIEGYLNARSDRENVALQQTLWTLLTSAESRFCH